MAYRALVCPQCGAPITEAPTKEVFYCSYCGAKIEQDKIAIEISGNVSVSGVANEMTLLDRAYLFLEYGNFSSADTYFERVLDLNPRLSKAYLGKLMAINHYHNTEEMVEQYVDPLDKNELFLKALRFANTDEYEELTKLKELIAQNHNEKIKMLQESVSTSEQHLEDLEGKLDSKKFKILKYSHRRALIIALLIVLSLLLILLISTLTLSKGNFGGYLVFILFFIAPCIAAIVGLLIWIKRIKKRKAKVEELEQEIECLRREISHDYAEIKEAEYKWNN